MRNALLALFKLVYLLLISKPSLELNCYDHLHVPYYKIKIYVIIIQRQKFLHFDCTKYKTTWYLQLVKRQWIMSYRKWYLDCTTSVAVNCIYFLICNSFVFFNLVLVYFNYSIICILKSSEINKSVIETIKLWWTWCSYLTSFLPRLFYIQSGECIYTFYPLN